jgi:hypothetical protein
MHFIMSMGPDTDPPAISENSTVDDVGVRAISLNVTVTGFPSLDAVSRLS